MMRFLAFVALVLVVAKVVPRRYRPYQINTPKAALALADAILRDLSEPRWLKRGKFLENPAFQQRYRNVREVYDVDGNRLDDCADGL